MLVCAPLAAAAPIDPGSFSGTVMVKSGGDDPVIDPLMEKSEALGLPSSGMVNVLSTFGNSARGEWNIKQTGGVATLDLDGTTGVSAPFGVIPRVQAAISFVTLEPVTYRFAGDVFSPLYTAVFAGIVADRFPDLMQPGGVGGSIPKDGVFEFTGVLEPGEYSLTLDLEQGGRFQTGTASAETRLELTVIPAASTGVAAVLWAWSAASRRRRCI
ncbi:MAG: hypothetical protein VYC34_03265 [Planctomycetota bacterium]|nr:hypothetical protein [Planctomycetota bacterium]